MSSERQIVINFSELNRVAVSCSHCKTEIVLDASNSKSELPEKCPSCRTNYDTGLSVAFESFKAGFGAMAKASVRVLVAE